MKKLLVFMIDALCACDIEQMKTLPNFGPIIENGSYVASLEPVLPALTYCCHTSIVTGRYVAGHGIYNNEYHKRGCKPGDVWFGMKKDVKAPTILDKARELGLTTCSLSWPVSAGADYTYNWPMIVPYHYDGDHPEDYLVNGNATQNLLDSYFWKYGRFQKGHDASLDLLTMSLAPDILRDYGQPDLMFVKMCDLDSARHMYGVYSDEAKYQLKKHDNEFGVLMEALRRYGDIENTNIVIMGDHGQTDVEDVLNINKLFIDNGFITVDENGKMVDCICYAHSTALSCVVELKNPDSKEDYNKVRSFLESLKDDPSIQLLYVLDKKEMLEKYNYDGPFDFVIESKRNISFSESLKEETIWATKAPGDHKKGMATHGSRPDRKETTLFIACGPSVKKGVILEKRSMVDEAVTMAKMVGFDMTGTDGKLMEEILK